MPLNRGTKNLKCPVRLHVLIVIPVQTFSADCPFLHLFIHLPTHCAFKNSRLKKKNKKKIRKKRNSLKFEANKLGCKQKKVIKMAK